MKDLFIQELAQEATQQQSRCGEPHPQWPKILCRLPAGHEGWHNNGTYSWHGAEETSVAI